MRRRGNRVLVTVDAEVDLSDFDTEDLLEELRSRDKQPLDSNALADHLPIIRQAYEALDRGDRQAAMHELLNALMPHDVVKAHEAAEALDEAEQMKEMRA